MLHTCRVGGSSHLVPRPRESPAMGEKFCVERGRRGRAGESERDRRRKRGEPVRNRRADRQGMSGRHAERQHYPAGTKCQTRQA